MSSGIPREATHLISSKANAAAGFVLLPYWLISASVVSTLRFLHVADPGHDVGIQILAAQNLIAGQASACSSMVRIIGFGASLYALGDKGGQSFGPLDPSRTFRIVIPAVLAPTLGLSDHVIELSSEHPRHGQKIGLSERFLPMGLPAA
jgi:hypothetical protein